MISIIKDNRIVSNMTFAIRFKSFAASVIASCQSGEEEKDYMLSVANALIVLQECTVDCPLERAYLERNGYLSKPLLFTTHDGVDYESSEVDKEVWSCMKKPSTGDQVLHHTLRSDSDYARISKSRAIFSTRERALEYLREHRPSFSIADLRNRGIYIDSILE